MAGKLENQSIRVSWRHLLAILCVFLVVIAGTAQVAHTHNEGADTHADCSLCAAAHVTVQMDQTPAAPAPAVAVIATLESLPAAVIPSVLCTFALFTRPPPAV
jgi:hypothetical protein